MATIDRTLMILRHEAAHAIACYRFQIPFTNVRAIAPSHDLTLDTDAINMARTYLLSNNQQNALVDSLCAMTRIAWLVDSSLSQADVTSEWENAGTDIYNSFRYIRIFAVERIGFPAVAHNPAQLDDIYGKFLQAGHKLATEILTHSSFHTALSALTTALADRSQLSDVEVIQIVEGIGGKALLISDSLVDHHDKHGVEQRAHRFKDAITALAGR